MDSGVITYLENDNRVPLVGILGMVVPILQPLSMDRIDELVPVAETELPEADQDVNQEKQD